MMAILSTLNYGLVLIYGSLLSVDFSGGFTRKKERWSVILLIIFTLSLQIFSGYNFGVDFTFKIYPLIGHLPMVILLIIVFKRSLGVALVSVVTAYFACQLPRWIATVIEYFFQVREAYLVAYTVSILIFFFILRKYFVKPVNQAMTYSKKSLVLFACLPLMYYLFDYITRIYTNALYQDIRIISEFLPAAMVLFYILFVVLYHYEVQQRSKIEFENTMLAMGLEQAASQIQNIKKNQELSQIYRHDLRHHLSLINTLCTSGDLIEVKDYLKTVGNDLENSTPRYYCQNEMVNLILSSFAQKALKEGVFLKIEAEVSENLSISKTELCAILSNGLENAITATRKVFTKERIVKIHCFTNKGNLLIHIENPYEGEIIMGGGLPQSNVEGHGFGVRSIELLSKKHDGYCSFMAEANYFSLKVVLPLG